ncbi:MAG: Fibronectin type domain protein [Microbacteriaceae bacterium]|nr:Fibronectin type domain protein [Microbacteriaceae bacterium]
MKTNPSAAHPATRMSSARRATSIGVSAAVLIAPFIIAVPTAAAAVPTFPDNIVVFPDRDFITIEGYQDRVGQTATVEVTRPGVGVVGSAKSVVSKGDVAFEINHPGGVCWGAGTALAVTPDIRPGDVVSMKFGATAAGDTTTQDVYVTAAPVLAADGVTVTVTGFVGNGVNQAQFEQRIVDPALKDTAVGRRDVRAVAGPLTPDDGYSSSLQFGLAGPNTFTATYVFDDRDAAEIAAAAGSGVRAMSWQLEDAAANRQGLTIAEFGELGGAGMGGCPNGPLQSGPAGPTDVVAATTSDSLKVTWTPAKAIPGTPAITGYRVHAVAQTAINGERAELGKRISSAAAKSTTISGLTRDETYDVFIVAVSSVGETFPAVHAIPVTDTVAPTVTASPQSGSFRTAQQVTLGTNEGAAEIYYTTDGSDVFLSGDILSEVAALYTEPLTIAATSTVNYAAIDPSGNISPQGQVVLTITDDPLPTAPTFSTAPVAGAGNVTLNWSAADPGAPGLSVTAYTIRAYTTDGAAAGPARTTAGDVTTLVFDGLAADTLYQFTVAASNANGAGPESVKSDPVGALGDLVANAGPDQSITRAATATTAALDGSGSTSTDVTYRWEQVVSGPTDPDRVTLAGATTAKPTFSLPLFATPMTNNPLTFRLTVTSGAKVRTDEVRITPVASQITVIGARWKSRDLRIDGVSSSVGGTVTIHSGGPTGPVIGRAPITAAPAPQTGGVFSYRLKTSPSNPGSVWLDSTLGGTAGPVTVTAG